MLDINNIQKIGDVVLKISLSIFLLVIAPLLLDQKTEENYAYVDHEGGYTAIGYIYKQGLYSDASIIGPGVQDIYGISNVRGFLESALINPEINPNAEINPEVHLIADAGIEWTGSAGDMKLTVHKVSLTSDDTPLVRDWLAAIVEMERNNQSDYKQAASRALRYEKAPD